MTEVLAQIALVLAIFLMMFAATPLFILGMLVVTGRPDVVAFLRRIADGLRGDS